MSHLTPILPPDHSTPLMSASTVSRWGFAAFKLLFKPPKPDPYGSTTVIPSTPSIKPPSSALKADIRRASLSSIKGMFTVASKSNPFSPLLTVLKPTAIFPVMTSPSASGLLVITRIVPVWEEAPKRVDCGPDSASIRAISTG